MNKVESELFVLEEGGGMGACDFLLEGRGVGATK
jgi:hypothetical protein